MNTRFMNAAMEVALSGLEAGKGGPFGAVIVKDGVMIAMASNEVIQNNDPTAHAEVNVIRKACEVLGTFQLDGCDLYTTCEPCPMCLGAIYWARPSRVFFAATRFDAATAGFDDSFIYDEINRPAEKRKIPFQQMKVEGIDVLFERWKSSPLKKPY